jgi:3-hydroxyisobutyrate dehydrogenase
MVPTSKHVKDVYLGDGGVMSALKKLDAASRTQTLCLDQSTIEQSASKEVALNIRGFGADMLDAPVSGGKLSRCSTPRSGLVMGHKGPGEHHG